MRRPSPGKGKGRANAWILAHVNYDGDWCLIWPFPAPGGYAQFSHLGIRRYAHRYMCELVKGSPPSPEHDAGHSCGRGHQGCIHPKHLDWKTKSENQEDRARHGTKNTWTFRGKITEADAVEIRALRGKLKQREIAVKFGISRANVSLIQNGNTWRPDKYRRGIDPAPWVKSRAA